ncbi:DUF11 domain-containing protein [Rubripirellula lacrimiformis]|nr:DUF11 domain-containing protein [Rubripirellula lacrimiformis]
MAAIAIPALLLLMISMTDAAQPDGAAVAVAVGNGDSVEGGEIRQVVGKQLERGGTRPGLLQSILSGSTSNRSTTHNTTARSDQSRGLLDGLFGGNSSRTSSTTTRHTTAPRSGTANSNTAKSGSVNWEGIPYHEADASNARTVPAPIRDPKQVAADSSTRIIRGGSTNTRTVPNQSSTASTSTRTMQAPTIARRPSAPVLPTPPADSVQYRMSATTGTANDLSTTSSSRRSNRRDVDAFAVAKNSTSDLKVTQAPEAPASDDVVDLVPRVSRRTIPATVAKTQVAKPAETKAVPAATETIKADSTKVAAKPAPAKTSVPTADVPKRAVAAETKVAETKVAETKVAETKVAETNVAAPNATASNVAATTPKPTAAPVSGTPALTASPAPAANSVATVPSASLDAPSAASPAYVTPVDPATTPVPTMTMSATPQAVASAPPVPAQPYAASMPSNSMPSNSMPASSVSHRAGPPAAAFAPAQALPNGTQYGSQATNFGPSGQIAIGSGLPQGGPRDIKFGGTNMNGSVATQDNFQPTPSITRPYVSTPSSSLPTYETARATRDPFDDPYGRRDDRHSFGAGPTSPNLADRSMGPATTAATSRNPNAGQSSAGDATSSVPMHPIAGYTASGSQATTAQGDNFKRTNDDSRNRMRTGSGQDHTVAGAGMASSELPGIRVVTRGPNEVMIRQTNEYEIRVENRGSINAEGLIVRAMIPDWAEVRGQNATRGEVESQGEGSIERLVWKIDQLPAGASEKLFVRLMAARSGTHDVDVDWTLMPQKTVTQIKVHEPQLDLTIEGPDEVVYGQSQTYKVRVLNPGDGVAPNVVFTLSPNSATPQTQRIGDIPAGKEAQFDVELTAQDLGDLKIHGLAAGDYELRSEATKTIRVSAAQIEAVLNGPELKYQNTEAMYNLQVENVGSATTERVVASLRLPAGVKYLGGIEGAQLRANTLTWEIASLADGATRDYQFRCNMTATGEHVFSFECKGTAAGHADVALTTRVESISDLVLTIHDPIAPAPIGSEVTYEIVVRNRGSREAKDVKTLAQFSHGIEPQRVEGQSGEVVTGQVVFDTIPRIGAGEEVHMKVVAIADRAGHHRFRTEVRSGDTVLVAEEATHYMSPQADRVSRRSSDSKQIR